MAVFFSCNISLQAQTLSDAQVAASPAVSSSNGYLTFSYYQLKNSPYLYWFQTSNTLLNWTTPNNPTQLSSVDGGITWFNTIRDTAPIGAIPARFLRLTIIDPTNIIDFLFPPTNLSVSLPPGATNIALNWSDNTQIETGYAILKETGTSDFLQIATVGPDVTTYNDYAVQGGTDYTYEVVAFDASEQSAPSNSASVKTLLDSNGDGIADIYKSLYGIDPSDDTISAGGSGLPDGWLVQYGLDPLTITNADVDVIGKGWTLAQDYAAGTNPNMIDTDGDGVPDCIDEYPLDKRRSQDIPSPPMSYLNISGTVTNGSNVSCAVLDDQGNVYFGCYGDLGAYDPAIINATVGSLNGAGSFQTWAWTDGAISAPSNFQLYFPGDSSGDPPDAGQIGGVGINGNLWGIFTEGYPNGGARQLVLDGSDTPPPYDGGGDIGFSIWSASLNTTWLVGSRNDYGGSFSGNFPLLIGDGLITYFDPSGYLPSNESGYCVSRVDFEPQRVNDSGCAIGYSSSETCIYWDGTNPHSLPGSASDLNNQGQVIGESGSNGFLWQSDSFETIRSLLPTTFRNQLDRINPAKISNQSTADKSVKILFNAESLEGSGAGSWVTRTFQLTCYTTSTSGSTPANTITEIQVPEGVNLLAGYQQNNFDGDLLAEGYDPSSSNINALRIFRIDFIPTDSSEGLPPTANGLVEQGYDPPQLNDLQFSTNGVGVAQDQYSDGSLKPEWWTSVGGSGSLATSQRVKVEFASDADAKSCRISVTSGGGSVTVTPTSFTSKETVLTITGNNSTQFNTPAVAQVFSLSGTSAIATLHIDVLPVRHISLGIYFVSDPNSPGTGLPGEVPAANDILTQLNNIYQQACINFVLSASGTLSIHYDLDMTGTTPTPNGYLNSDNANDPEFEALDTSGSLAGGKLNLIILGKLQHTVGGRGDGILGEELEGPGYSTNKVYIYAQAIAGFGDVLQNDAELYHVAAHEIGHALTLSTRFYPGYDNGPEHHDPGPFPEGPRTGLMWPSTGPTRNLPDNSTYHWLRHEDWEAANAAAKNDQ